MKYLSKITPCICAILFLIGQGGILTSCNDDLAADSYYTFTGEMMSDFLANREDFSQFKRIVERAGRMDLLASRGARTLFPPVNSGVEAFLMCLREIVGVQRSFYKTGFYQRVAKRGRNVFDRGVSFFF